MAWSIRHTSELLYFCTMIIIGNTLLSDELYLEHFFCDLQVCKGGCCVHGDAGAPLEADETRELETVYPFVKPFMTEGGINAVESLGLWEKDEDGELTTPLVEGNHCAYVFYDQNDIAKCAIEQAYHEGLIRFQKPLSCHLYPIRITSYPHYDALNYHRWPICNCARKKGKKMDVRIYRFVKDALIRKYGSSWYEELEAYIRYSFEDTQ